MAYLVKRRAVLWEEAPVALGEIQGDGVAQWMMRCNGDERCVYRRGIAHKLDTRRKVQRRERRSQ